ncbi:hypothetical protein [Nocardia sp. alder85J]|uniref:hypothetical protein n=1 Tax=Nocardia sp. alder85J TaxID=2862949 RepID=UPI001CD77C06|nr:hypothetical protein [Nocardia sp. alder85J]MCX4094909.1 hypothetical protein [Nocardia sp. alder85J]
MQRLRRSVAPVAGALAALAATAVTGAGPAVAAPLATLRGGATITAHVIGERPGYRCQIAAHDVDGPWRPVGADGVVDLDSGRLPTGRHVVSVLCEDRGRGDGTVHTVARNTEVFTR